jgi:hypothetical protein
MAFMLQLQIKQPGLENEIELKIIWKTIGCFPSRDSGWWHDTRTVWWRSTKFHTHARKQTCEGSQTVQTANSQPYSAVKWRRIRRARWNQ